MKPVKCSWVDMQKIRQSLASCERGNQKRLEEMRCVTHQTVSQWQAACDIIESISDKCYLNSISVFQPTHAAELARHLRKIYGKNRIKWPEIVSEEITDWIDVCEADNLTVAQFRDRLRDSRIEPQEKQKGCTVDDLGILIEKGIKFRTIYADPPWQYGNQRTRAATDNHYGTMSIDEIADMPIEMLADDICHLHLWTTNGFLVEALGLVEKWGFEFKSTFVWVKPQLGIGNYWRCSHEIMLLGVRGGLTFPANGIPSWIEADRTRHSAKPNKIRNLIEQVSKPNRLELFGREAHDGWVVFGNQISRGLFTQGIEKLEATSIA